jgi:hypothetical protein
MIFNEPLCLKGRISKIQWSKYIKGASVIFTWYMAGSEMVTVLSPPPPGRFHPSGMTTYQAIEEPILKWAIAGGANLRIELDDDGIDSLVLFENPHYSLVLS